jgi:hypothetical protein
MSASDVKFYLFHARRIVAVLKGIINRSKVSGGRET